MAYLIGIVSEEEAATLKARGWELGDFDDDFIGEISRQIEENTNGTPEKMVVVYVDNNLFNVMSGPDWDKSEAPLGEAPGIVVPEVVKDQDALRASVEEALAALD